MLGTLVVAHRDRELVVSSAHQRCVLALLLLEADRVVSVDRLVDVLWSDDEVPKTARNVVQGCVSGLRRLLAADPGVRLAHQPPGYRLVVDPERVDLHRFRALRGQPGDGGDRAAVLRQALDLWRGEPLADVAAPGLAAVKQTLVESRLSTLEDYADLELRAGRHGGLVHELTSAAAEHPLRERLHGLLMRALHRAGRPGDALKVFQDIRVALSTELGVDPSAELRRLHGQVLRTDPELDPPTRAAVGSAAVGSVGVGSARVGAVGTGAVGVGSVGMGAVGVVPRQLPPDPAGFTGRGDELAGLTATLDARAREGKTVVISAIGGAGGIGKTWLVLHWAHRHADRFPDGQLFVDLRGFSPEGQPMTPTVATRGFLDALGVEVGRIPLDPHAQTALFRTLVADKRLLVVLDNAFDAAQVTPLLPGSGSCTVLVTSRDKLPGLIIGHGAHHVPLDVLGAAAARDLLVNRLGAARVAAEPAAVDELIALCGGFPLALSIVAGRAHTRPRFSLAAIAAELRVSGIDALDDGDPAASLPAVLSWSYRALSPEQARVLALLATAPGPHTSLPAAASLCGLPPGRTTAVLRSLERASLLTVDPAGRHRMHDLIRHYAAERAEHDVTAGDRSAALRRVVDFYLHTAHAGDRLLNPVASSVELDPAVPGCRPQPLSDDAAALDWFDTEHPCLLAAHHAAVAEGLHQVVWKLAKVLETFHRRRSRLHDSVTLWRAAHAAAGHLGDPVVRTVTHRHLGGALARTGRPADALDHLHQAAAVADRIGDAPNLAVAHLALAWALEQRGDDREALEHTAQALGLYRRLGNPVREAMALNGMGWYAARLGHYDDARGHCEAALLLNRRHRHRDGEAGTLDSLAYIDHHTGRHEASVARYREALEIFRELDDVYQIADSLDHIGLPHAALGQHDEARSAWREALRMYRAQRRDDDAERVRGRLAALDAGPEQDR
ncbi:AfsR/SARP family transcriptional regulator [Actinosynnema sp. CS-041913]|uniref:AfsR/SARP family transcriptional regulator n=1 Tax=Actinosynnema sp. CS-041913 TaxID=3239917 RepID=UPI003D903B2C